MGAEPLVGEEASMQGVPAEEAPAPSALPGELRAAVLALDHDAVAALIVQTEAWGVEAKALAVWAKMQATRKGKFPWNKQKPVREEGEEGEEEEPEEEEEDEEEEPFDFADEEWQAEITEEIFGGPLPGKFTVAKIVKLGVFEGEREPRPAEIDVPFDAMVTARQGYGVNLAPGGEVYAGEFGENVRSGHGAMLYPKQGLYVGFWKEGRRHGHGKMAYADGSTYEGAWAFGKRHGKGTFRYANGDSYVGSFFNGKKDGAGVYRAAAAETKFDGAFGGGQLLAGKALTPDGAYYGTFKKGAADGKGAWALPNGVVVEGVNAGKLPEDADEEDEEAKLEYSWQGGAISTAGTATDEVLRASLCIAKPKPKIVISGPPAGGKGTQCEHIKAQFGCYHISTGDMLRAAAADEENEVGQLAKEKMEAGELVPDELICALLQQELEKPEAQEKGWLLDGFPRTGGQVKAMERMFIVPNKVIVLQVPDEVLLARVLGRRMDPETGTIYHLEFNPVPEGEEHEAITARLITREDDTEEKFGKRIAAFHENEQVLLDAYPNARILDGNRPPDEVSADIAIYLAA